MSFLYLLMLFSIDFPMYLILILFLFYLLFFFFFFFFSSRRRHTRLVSDWSSDVCSSDLPERRFAAAAQAGDDDQLVARDLEREVFEVVLPGAADLDEFFAHAANF